MAAPSAAAAACPSPLLGRPSPHDLCNSVVGSVQCTSRACWLVKSPSSLGCTPFPIRRCPCSSPHPTCLCRQHAGRQPSERSFWEAWGPCWMHTRQRKLCSGWVHWRQPDQAAAVLNVISVRGYAAHGEARCTLLFSQPSPAAGSGCTVQPGMQASWHASSSSKDVVPDVQTSCGWGGVFRGAMHHPQNPTCHLKLSSPAASMLA